MPYLVCYDIRRDNLRTRFSKKIIGSGLDRINKSVYLGMLPKSSLTNLEQWIQSELSQQGLPTDSCIIISVGAEQVQRMRVYGQNDLDPDELSGDKSTLMV